MLPPRLLARTYSRSVIWGTAICIALLGVISAAILTSIFPPDGKLPGADSILRILDDEAPELVEPDITKPDVPGRLATIADNPEALLYEALNLHRTASQEERYTAIKAWPTGTDPQIERGCIDTVGPLLISYQGEEPPAELQVLAKAEPPERWANQALGEFLRMKGKELRALDALAREGQLFEDADSARRIAIYLAVGLGQEQQLDEWQRDPRWAQHFDARTRVEQAASEGDWPGVLRWLLPSRYGDPDWNMILIATVAAAVWLFFLYHCSYGAPRRRELALQCLLGFGLGIVSTWLTIFLIYVYEHHGFEKGDTFFSLALYCIAGVGLREEMAKLICFLPLLWWVVKRGSPIAWLLVPSCVGAGFAAEENINYFRTSMGGGLSGRFLTANFLHVVLTGLIGQSLCQACHWPKTHFPHFISTLLLGIAIHGLYNFFLMLPALQGDLSLLSMMIFIVIGMYYFTALHQVRSASRPRLSLTMTFAGGLILSLAVAFVVLSLNVGMRGAATVLVPGFLSAAIFLIMFVRGIGDGLSD